MRETLYFAFAAIVLAVFNYGVSVYLLHWPWLTLILGVAEFAGYFIYSYLKSTDRYLIFQPRHFTKIIHEDILEAQKRIRDDLAQTLKAVQSDFVSRVQAEMNEAVPELRTTIEENLKQMQLEFDHEIEALDHLKQEQVDVIQFLNDRKSEFEKRFEDSVKELYRDFYEFKYPRYQEARRDFSRMHAKLDSLQSVQPK